MSAMPRRYARDPPRHWRTLAQAAVLTPAILAVVGQGHERMRLSATQAALLLEVVADSPPHVQAAAQRMAVGRVVPDDEAEAVVSVLAAAMFEGDYINPAMDDMLGLVQQLS